MLASRSAVLAFVLMPNAGRVSARLVPGASFSSTRKVGFSSSSAATSAPTTTLASSLTCSESELQLQKSASTTHPSFDVLSTNHIKEYNAYCTVYKHKTSGAEILSVSADDDNKVFGVTFRTPPTDSTGAPHILEHSVLCGSRKYTSKEPFVELIKGSLNTFLNAFTYPDRTCYPVASRNLKVSLVLGLSPRALQLTSLPYPGLLQLGQCLHGRCAVPPRAERQVCACPGGLASRIGEEGERAMSNAKWLQK